MIDLDRRFESLDRLDAPDLWTDIEYRTELRRDRVPFPRSRFTQPARPGVLVALGAAVVILAVVGLTTWLLVGSGSNSPPVITQDTTPTSPTPTLSETTLSPTSLPATTVPTADAIPDFEALGWQSAPSDTAVLGGDTFGAHWDQIIAGPEGYLAWGYTWNREDVARLCDGISCAGGGSELFQGAAWTSGDGATWTKHSAPDLLSAYVESPFPGGTITVGGPGFVGAAAWAEEPVSGPFGLLSSPDGTTWTSTSLEPNAVLYDIVVGASQWVAVGSFEDAETGESGGAAWNSADGQTWQRADLYSDVDDPDNWGFKVTDVVAGGPGYVAVRGNLQTWTSTDGISWTKGEDLPGFTQPDGTYLSAISLELLALEESLVAIGQGGVVWSSSDGISWSLVHEQDFGLDETLVPWLKTAWQSGLGIVAYGMVWPDEDSLYLTPDGQWEQVQSGRTQVVFISPDGTNWTTLDAPPLLRTVGPYGDNGIIAAQYSAWPPMTSDLAGVNVFIWTPPG